MLTQIIVNMVRLCAALDMHAATRAELLAVVMFVEPGAAADNHTLAGAQLAFLNFDIALLDDPSGGSMQARFCKRSHVNERLGASIQVQWRQKRMQGQLTCEDAACRASSERHMRGCWQAPLRMCRATHSSRKMMACCMGTCPITRQRCSPGLHARTAWTWAMLPAAALRRGGGWQRRPSPSPSP